MLAYPRTAIVGFVLLLLPVTAGAVTFNVFFSGVGSIPSGTVTYTSTGDLVPSSFTFTQGLSPFAVWTELDALTVGTGPGFNTQWSGPTPTSFNAPSGEDFTIEDDVIPGPPSGNFLTFDSSDVLCGVGNTWCTPASFGTYTFSPVPEPTTLSMVALGALALGLRRRRVAVK